MWLGLLGMALVGFAGVTEPLGGPFEEQAEALAVLVLGVALGVMIVTHARAAVRSRAPRTSLTDF
jgi:hypothetical protein